MSGILPVSGSGGSSASSGIDRSDEAQAPAEAGALVLRSRAGPSGEGIPVDASTPALPRASSASRKPRQKNAGALIDQLSGQASVSQKFEHPKRSPDFQFFTETLPAELLHLVLSFAEPQSIVSLGLSSRRVLDWIRPQFDQAAFEVAKANLRKVPRHFSVGQALFKFSCLDDSQPEALADACWSTRREGVSTLRSSALELVAIPFRKVKARDKPFVIPLIQERIRSLGVHSRAQGIRGLDNIAQSAEETPAVRQLAFEAAEELIDEMPAPQQADMIGFHARGIELMAKEQRAPAMAGLRAKFDALEPEHRHDTALDGLASQVNKLFEPELLAEFDALLDRYEASADKTLRADPPSTTKDHALRQPLRRLKPEARASRLDRVCGLIESSSDGPHVDALAMLAYEIYSMPPEPKAASVRGVMRSLERLMADPAASAVDEDDVQFTLLNLKDAITANPRFTTWEPPRPAADQSNLLQELGALKDKLAPDMDLGDH